MKHEGLGSDERSKLEAYAALLEERALPAGFVSIRDRDRLWERHILDSLRAADAVRLEDVEALDLGSGAGLPGVVVAIVRPALRVGLVESRRVRVAFLELVVESLGLGNASVLATRVEDLEGSVDLCFARAFGDPAASWSAARNLLAPSGRLVYFAGGRFRAPRDVPDGAAARVVADRPLESGGPLVIMTRQ